MKLQKFSLSRVVTKNIVIDSFQGLRNFFGLRLRSYEKMIDKHTNELIKDAEYLYKISWWRLSINPLAKGSAMITIYGEGERR